MYCYNMLLFTTHHKKFKPQNHANLCYYYKDIKKKVFLERQLLKNKAN